MNNLYSLRLRITDSCREYWEKRAVEDIKVVTLDVTQRYNPLLPTIQVTADGTIVTSVTDTPCNRFGYYRIWQLINGLSLCPSLVGTRLSTRPR
ncbi:MAG TPA: hypothetical protein VEG44_01460 [Candidatus Acidoferrales bacterium]|nr:hypothetical protein [Candidatus Acidoferrales bacterium]